MRRFIVCVSLAVCLGTASGCRSTGDGASGPYATQEGARRETAKAERLTKEAAELLSEDPDQAEKLLREALTADIFFGPAHNNLGVIHLGRGDLYEAANEFEWSRKLMPGHPDPRYNLAMTLEQAGQVDEALASYSAALEVYDGFLPAIQGLALLTVKSGLKDDRTAGWLEAIALRSSEASWREWARRELTEARLVLPSLRD